MMKPFLIILITIVFLEFKAQENKKESGYKLDQAFDLALSTNINQHCGALSWTKFHSLTKKKRFKIGYGLRFTAQGGNNLYYVTAPAILTSKQTGPQVLFSPIYYENVDTFIVTKSQNNMINASINLQYTIKEKFDFGFNIDAIGFSFGNKVLGKYIAYQSAQTGTKHFAKPTAFNLLLVSDNDLGALNSELYFRYWFNKKWAIKTGATFLFTEYTTENKLRLDNNRWRNKALMGLIAISFSPFR